MIGIVSSGADGTMVVYNVESRQETMTFKLLGYPGYYNDVVSVSPHHYEHMVELIRLGATNHVATSRTMGSSVMTARLALASGYQSLLRLNIQGGRNVASVSLLEQNDSCLLLIRDMLGVKLFRFDETTLSVISLMRGH
ncbi:hypothetical protein JH06_5394 [Blastocystis sp. subtype 4]|uniref:hypothetical protein n=1 Tax=Blastocystis sp. subtype 4 TaxID=944170 RepID=UPI0007113BC8|nr:hypothetical protein JH06_5394 [Blastocystis sp. subtype 4]KNB44061.1 hypothetical protein JH06_5394 [Blastocystis sp. subtype 4]|eukprot:XP_014527520.1 hypothetical protein JH06_5394 [Blastocystis sp. subtype 4]